MQPNETGNVINAIIGYQNKGFSTSLAYLHSFNTGRFLFPRELGRENFYVSQLRSWIDGFGDTDIWMLRFKYRPTNERWKDLSLDARISQTIVSDKDNPTSNKYKLPSFYQLTFLGKYKCHGWYDGLTLNLLYVTKYAPSSENLNQAQKFYQSGFHHFSFMMNLSF